MSLCDVWCLPTRRDQMARPKANPQQRPPGPQSVLVLSSPPLTSLIVLRAGPEALGHAVFLLPFLRCLEPKPTLAQAQASATLSPTPGTVQRGACGLAVTLGAPCGAVRTGTLSASSWLRSQPPRTAFSVAGVSLLKVRPAACTQPTS